MIGLTAATGVALGLLLAQGLALALEYAGRRIGYTTILYGTLLAGLLFGWWWAFTRWTGKDTTMPDTTKTCAVCGGELIGSELAYGTCGHCGGRALR